MAKQYRNISPNGILTTTYGVYGPNDIIHNAASIPPKVLASWLHAKPRPLIAEEESEEGEELDLETRLTLEDDAEEFTPGGPVSNPNPDAAEPDKMKKGNGPAVRPARRK